MVSSTIVPMSLPRIASTLLIITSMFVLINELQISYTDSSLLPTAVAQDPPDTDPTSPEGGSSLIPNEGDLSAEDGTIAAGDCNFVSGEFKAMCIPVYIRYLIRLAFQFAGAIFLIVIIIAGYRIAIGSVTGDKEAGQNQLKGAIIGFLVCSLAFFIIDFIIGALAGF